MTALHEQSRALFADLQATISTRLESLDGRARFREERWSHREGGGGVTRVLEGGRVFERAGVNLADVRGELSERLAERLGAAPQPFVAAGLSLVIHPLSPRVPTVHLNLRHIRLLGPGRPAGAEWFGGGADLTPYYLEHEDARHFHATWREVCNRHDPSYHARFKKWCDDYFRIAHRDEARGIGGIFFDYLDPQQAGVPAFVADVGRSFLDAYVPIVERRMGDPWWERERAWQLARRGRYVEFNLIYDRGTLFGLETGGRIESILMSLPPLARWIYDQRPEPGSPEAALVEVLRTPRDWL